MNALNENHSWVTHISSRGRVPGPPSLIRALETRHDVDVSVHAPYRLCTVSPIEHQPTETSIFFNRMDATVSFISFVPENYGFLDIFFFISISFDSIVIYTLDRSAGNRILYERLVLDRN